MVPIILNGFYNDYEIFMSSVVARENVPSFGNMYDIFLHFKRCGRRIIEM